MKSSPPKLNRAADAFAAAPAAGAALVAGIAVLGMVGDAVWRGLPFAVLPVAVTMLGAMIFLTAALFLYIAAIVLGYPGYLLCRHKQWTRRIHWILLFAIVDCVAVGALYPLGILLAVTTLPGTVTIDIPDALALLSLGSVVAGAMLVGAVSGLTFARIIQIEPPSPETVALAFE